MNPDSGSGRDNLPLVLAILAVVVVVGMAAYLLGSGALSKDGPEPPARTAGSTTTVIIKQRGRKPRSVVSPEQTQGGSGGRTWPDGMSAYTVVLQSASTRPEAEKTAREAQVIETSTGVLLSSNYPSLRPGYWVAWAGQYDSRSEAVVAAGRFRSKGHADAYPRYISATKRPGSSKSGGSPWPAYTVVLASESSQQQASAGAGRARRAGLPGVGVLDSDDHSSLRPGYWVAYSGQYSSQSEASSAVRKARQAGFGGAYSRYVSG